MLELYGGSLTVMKLYASRSRSRCETLASLVRRQHALEKVFVQEPEALPALVHLIMHGCLSNVRELQIELNFDGVTSDQHLRLLLTVIEQVPGALESLEILHLLPDHWPPGKLPKIAETLSYDVAPNLRVLDLLAGMFQDEDLEALADMLQYRGLDKLVGDELMNQEEASAGARICCCGHCCRP